MDSKTSRRRICRYRISRSCCHREARMDIAPSLLVACACLSRGLDVDTAATVVQSGRMNFASHSGQYLNTDRVRWSVVCCSCQELAYICFRRASIRLSGLPPPHPHWAVISLIRASFHYNMLATIMLSGERGFDRAMFLPSLSAGLCVCSGPRRTA